ncbi:MAG: TIM barrel protein [Planctomycetota bacterium]
MKRRTFIQTSGAAALSLSLTKPLWAVQVHKHYMDSIGLQVWTVRNQLEKDAPGTIKAIADAGYKQIELGGDKNAEYIKLAKDNGMKATSAFIDWTILGKRKESDLAKFDKVVEQASANGLKHLVFGYIGKGFRETADDYKHHAENANKAGEKCKAAGIQLCYHNHSFEFGPLKDSNGKAGFDILVDQFDPKLCKFEVDVFWVAIGGRDPIKTMRSLKGRVSQVHLKDLLKGAKTQYDEGKVPHEAFEELGDGTIDMLTVLKVAKEIGVEQCHVEQDQSPDPIKSIGQSMKHLHAINKS